MTLIDPARLKAGAPLIQFITNTVVQQFSANVALAIGASPAMVDNGQDAADFARVASGLVVNFGTPSEQSYAAAREAIPVANERGNPWVLDPVGIGIPYRTERIHAACAQRPSVIRGNASEIAALAGAGAGGRGVESTDEVDAVLGAAVTLAQDSGAVVAVSGPVDAVVAIVDGGPRVIRLAGGHATMPLVIGTGCALGGVVAAYAAALHDAGTPLDADVLSWATATAHAHVSAAGFLAGQIAEAPGSFAVAFLDQLWRLSDAGAERLAELVEVTVEGTA